MCAGGASCSYLPLLQVADLPSGVRLAEYPEQSEAVVLHARPVQQSSKHRPQHPPPVMDVWKEAVAQGRAVPSLTEADASSWLLLAQRTQLTVLV